MDEIGALQLGLFFHFRLINNIEKPGIFLEISIDSTQQMELERSMCVE